MKENANSEESNDRPTLHNGRKIHDNNQSIRDLESGLLRQEYDIEHRLTSARIKAENQRRKITYLRKLVGIVLFLAAVPLVTAGFYGVEALIVNWPTLLAVLCVTVGILLTMPIATSRSFSDVDRVKSEPNPADAWPFPTTTSTRIDPTAAWPFPTGSSPDEDEDDDDENNQGDSELIRRLEEEKLLFSKSLSRKFADRDQFREYFISIKQTLERKADAADEKASILLDKGTGYTKLGIWFFAISIFVWQLLSWANGFHSYYIYGIVSCSGLFIFIEFISAWFLKQYRHYVDTSTYLIRVKSIFDRFMLVYLSIKSSENPTAEDADRRLQMLIELLSKEISWPESYLQKKQDFGFAREAMEAITLLTKELRNREEKKG